MTKILAVSDIHGDSNLVRTLAKEAEKEKADVIILCGDILGLQDKQNLISPFKSLNIPVFIIPGNWDAFESIDFISNLYKIKNLHGDSSIINDTAIFGAGGGYPGPAFLTDKDMSYTLRKAHSKIKDITNKIMVTHIHPAGSKSEFSGVPGSKAIRNAIKYLKPKFLIHGHIHEGSGLEETIYNTKVINVSQQGKIFEI
jgi:Icc-related predicted phosphoesterase